MPHSVTKSVTTTKKIAYLTKSGPSEATLNHYSLIEFRLQVKKRAVRGEVELCAVVGDNAFPEVGNPIYRFILRDEDFDALAAAQTDGDIGNLTPKLLLAYLESNSLIGGLS